MVRWCWVKIWDLIESVSEGFLTYSSSAGASYNLDYSRAKAHCACSTCRCGLELFGHFYSHLSFSLLFLPLFGRQPDIDGNTVSKGR